MKIQSHKCVCVCTGVFVCVGHQWQGKSCQHAFAFGFEPSVHCCWPGIEDLYPGSRCASENSTCAAAAAAAGRLVGKCDKMIIK